MSLRAAILISLAALVLAAASVSAADRWAVLLSGSSGYYNYRHQADTCHAYQLLINAGVHPDHIIHLAYDDIANHTANPFPGRIFNAPSDSEGENVYQGCKIDYRGEQVNVNTFMAVLRGDAAALKGGKVLRSTAEDNVFLFYSDHGSTGVLAMPSGPYLTAKGLHEALRDMKERRMYNKMVVYVEACSSGSMFHEILPPDVRIYATTASDPDESSWGTYCPPLDMVNGKAIGACLGDEYSVNWMESTEALGMEQTLADQYRVVRNLTKLSSVNRYGDKSLWENPIADFMAGSRNWAGPGRSRPSSRARPQLNSAAAQLGKVDSRDIPLQNAFWRYLRATDLSRRVETAAELVSQVNSRISQDLRYERLAKQLGHHQEVEGIMRPSVDTRVLLSSCFDGAIDRVYRRCGGFTDYSLRYARLLAHLCARHTSEQVADAIEEVCREPYMPQEKPVR